MIARAAGRRATRATLERTVADDDTAEAVGSGSLPVLGTPRLLAWCEAATCAAVAPCLAEGETTVGHPHHLRAPRARRPWVPC